MFDMELLKELKGMANNAEIKEYSEDHLKMLYSEAYHEICEAYRQIIDLVEEI